MPEAYEDFDTVQRVLGNIQHFGIVGNDTPLMTNMNYTSVCDNSLDSQGNTSGASPMSTVSSPFHGMSCISLDNIPLCTSNPLMMDNMSEYEKPYLTILEQPAEKFRFRYKSEMIGTHGSLLAASSSSNRRKRVPTVQLNNYPDRAIIRCTLFTSEETCRIPHAHRLVRRERNSERDEPHDIDVSQKDDFIASFHGLSIIHTAKKYVRDELIKKIEWEKKLENGNTNGTLKMREKMAIKTEVDVYQKCINLNSVALCFQAFHIDQNQVMIPITERVFSKPINNLKSALTGELKICRINTLTSSCEGGQEVFILVEKVGKKNIRVKFFELNSDDHEIWMDRGRFSELDVHHQYAIVFGTPPYRDLDITEPRDVFIQLERPSDGACSEPMKFTYKPSDRIIGKKRPRLSDSYSAEFIQTSVPQYTAPAATLFKSIDSRELSNELKRLASQGCSSMELNEFINSGDIEEYMELLNNSETITLDGHGRNQLGDSMFAKNVVVEAFNIQMEQSDPKEAASYNKKRRLKKLLMDRSTYGDSILHSALRHEQRVIVKYILILIASDPEYMELVNIQNNSGKTPLHYAVLQNQVEVVKALLILKADPNIRDSHGFSPLHIAVQTSSASACVEILLTEKMINIEAHNDLGWTPLQIAAQTGFYDAVRLLIQAGANVNDTEMSNGRTVLHLAVEGGHKEIVEFLLETTNIDINKRTFSGNTALHIAVAYAGAQAKELCTLLIEHGADPYIQNHTREAENDDEKNSQVTYIKEEIDSEEENSNKQVGQSSFDLASNKPEILRLFNDHSGNTETDKSVYTSVTKEEIVDDDEQKSWMNLENKQKLSAILDRTQGWKKLVDHFNLNFILSTFQENLSSPSLVVLNYIDVQIDVSLIKMQHLFKELEEEEAASFMVEILTQQ